MQKNILLRNFPDFIYHYMYSFILKSNKNLCDQLQSPSQFKLITIL